MSHRNQNHQSTPQYNNTSPRIPQAMKNDNAFTESDFQDSDRQMTTKNFKQGAESSDFNHQPSLGGIIAFIIKNFRATLT